MVKRKVRCSFCGKEEKDVRKITFRKDTPREGVCICNDCIALCKDIISEDDTKTSNRAHVSSSDMHPSKIKAFLDEHIIGQERAKVAMSVAIYNHYKRIEDVPSDPDDEVTLTKGNILMIGPTGCGKTLIAQTIARILNVPFTVADATTLTEAGYVGEDVENVIKNLWLAADKDVERASRGIVCIDEIDKIATKGGNSAGRDVGGEGVQQALLRMIESGVVSITPDGNKNRPSLEFIQIDTTNILFIMTGAFNNLVNIVQGRAGTSTLGFNNQVSASNADADKKLLQQVETQDIVKFGLIPEFMGRIPVIVTLDDLDEEALLEIMWRPKNSLIKQYERLFELENVKLKITEDGKRAIVKEAVRRKSGARGLRSIFEDVMLDIMYEIPSMEGVAEVTINAGVVEKKNEPILSFFKDAS